MAKITRTPLTGDNTPNDLDPAVVDRLTELDRTDPIDPNDFHGDHVEPGSSTEHMENYAHAVYDSMSDLIDPGPTGLDFEAAMKLEGEKGSDLELVDSWQDHVPADFDPATHRTANPYILESNTVLNDLRSAANQARRTIAALDREIDDLDRTADEQIALINARRDANKAQREKRKEDLMKIVSADAMVNGQPQEQGE